MEPHRLHQLTFADIAADRSFQLLERPIYCPDCRMLCVCEGYDGQGGLLYSCLDCQKMIVDKLPCKPLFALPPLEAALRMHFEIDCPYCHERAFLVGGSPRDGLYFVCENRCHRHLTRAIRRY